MSQHPNARLTPKGRETLVSRVGSGLGVAEAARQMGVSRQAASKWLARVMWLMWLYLFGQPDESLRALRGR